MIIPLVTLGGVTGGLVFGKTLYVLVLWLERRKITKYSKEDK